DLNEAGQAADVKLRSAATVKPIIKRVANFLRQIAVISLCKALDRPLKLRLEPHHDLGRLSLIGVERLAATAPSSLLCPHLCLSGRYFCTTQRTALVWLKSRPGGNGLD